MTGMAALWVAFGLVVVVDCLAFIALMIAGALGRDLDTEYMFGLGFGGFFGLMMLCMTYGDVFKK